MHLQHNLLSLAKTSYLPFPLPLSAYSPLWRPPNDRPSPFSYSMYQYFPKGDCIGVASERCCQVGVWNRRWTLRCLRCSCGNEKCDIFTKQSYGLLQLISIWIAKFVWSSSSCLKCRFRINWWVPHTAVVCIAWLGVWYGVVRKLIAQDAILPAVNFRVRHCRRKMAIFCSIAVEEMGGFWRYMLLPHVIQSFIGDIHLTAASTHMTRTCHTIWNPPQPPRILSAVVSLALLTPVYRQLHSNHSSGRSVSMRFSRHRTVRYPLTLSNLDLHLHLTCLCTPRYSEEQVFLRRGL